jgi:membrane-bound ClpP family serine protease
MEEVKSNSGQNLGIAALITGIITFVLAVIPCVGIIAIIPGIIAIVLASVGLSQASRNNSPKGILLAGLIIGIIAVMISFSQVFVAGKIVQKAHNDKWPSGVKSVIDDVKDNVMKDLEDANVSIKIESKGDTVTINAKSNKKDLEQKLEDLESGKKQKNDTIKKGK